MFVLRCSALLVLSCSPGHNEQRTTNNDQRSNQHRIPLILWIVPNRNLCTGSVTKRVAPLRLLKGVEVNIKADGTLDLPDEVLAERDWVVASIHTAFDRDPTDTHVEHVSGMSLGWLPAQKKRAALHDLKYAGERRLAEPGDGDTSSMRNDCVPMTGSQVSTHTASAKNRR